MFDDSLRAAFRGFSTLFLIAATVTVTVHLAYGLVFKRTISVREIHPAIEQFPGERQVRSVGTAELQRARWALALATLVEIALIPAAAKAAEQALRGEPTALRSWRAALSERSGFSRRATRGIARDPLGVLAACLLGLLTIVAAERAGLIVTEMLPDRSEFAGDIVSRGLARALGAPFILAPLALAAMRAKDRPPSGPTIY